MLLQILELEQNCATHSHCHGAHLGKKSVVCGRGARVVCLEMCFYFSKNKTLFRPQQRPLSKQVLAKFSSSEKVVSWVVGVLLGWENSVVYSRRLYYTRSPSFLSPHLFGHFHDVLTSPIPSPPPLSLSLSLPYK